MEDIEGPAYGAGATSYDEPVAQSLVQALKFEGIRSAARPLGSLVAKYVTFHCPVAIEKIGLIPIPLHARRERERGFNQAELIAREVSRRTGTALLPKLLMRTRATRPQTVLQSREERETNIAECFTCSVALPPHITTLILIDDVTTSGATFRAAARAVRHTWNGVLFCIAAAQA